MTELIKKEDVSNYLSKLTPKQTKFAQKKVMTNMSDDELCKDLNISKRELKKYAKNKYVQEYIGFLNKEYATQSLQQAQIQTKFLADKMFENIATRFEEFDEENVPDFFEKLSTPEKMAYRNKYFSEMNAKDAFKTFKEFIQLQENKFEQHEETQEEFVTLIRQTHTRKKRARRELEKKLESIGMDRTKIFEDLVMNPDGTFESKGLHEVQDDNVSDMEIEETSYEEVSVFRRKKDE